MKAFGRNRQIDRHMDVMPIAQDKTRSQRFICLSSNMYSYYFCLTDQILNYHESYICVGLRVFIRNIDYTNYIENSNHVLDLKIRFGYNLFQFLWSTIHFDKLNLFTKLFIQRIRLDPM